MIIYVVRSTVYLTCMSVRVTNNTCISHYKQLYIVSMCFHHRGILYIPAIEHILENSCFHK